MANFNRPFNYSASIATDAAEAAIAHRLYGSEVSVIRWEDGREELVEGTVEELVEHVAELAEEAGCSISFSVRPASEDEIRDAA